MKTEGENMSLIARLFIGTEQCISWSPHAVRKTCGRPMCEDAFIERKTVMIGINNEMLQRFFVATQQPTSSIYIVIAITNDPTLSCHSIAATFD